MPGIQRVVLRTKYSSAEIWSIAENAVLAAADRVTGVRPSLMAPVDRYLPDDQSIMKYYGVLDDIIDNNDGLVVDFVASPPLTKKALAKANFLTLVYAVEKRLTSMGEKQ